MPSPSKALHRQILSLETVMKYFDQACRAYDRDLFPFHSFILPGNAPSSSRGVAKPISFVIVSLFPGVRAVGSGPLIGGSAGRAATG